MFRNRGLFHRQNILYEAVSWVVRDWKGSRVMLDEEVMILRQSRRSKFEMITGTERLAWKGYPWCPFSRNKNDIRVYSESVQKHHVLTFQLPGPGAAKPLTRIRLPRDGCVSEPTFWLLMMHSEI